MRWSLLLFACFFCLVARRVVGAARGRCKTLHLDICSGLGYNVSFATDNDGGNSKLEFFGYKSLLERHCPEHFMTFVCGVYFPKCSQDSRTRIYPCRSLCEAAKSECERIMSDSGLAWPKKFNCRRFRKKVNCVNGVSDRQRIALPEPKVTVPPSCERVTIPMCENIGYNFTHYPTSRHRSQDDAGLEIHQYYPIVRVQCSPHILQFLCSYYAPECSDTHQAIRPCRSLCQAARDGCRELLTRFSFSWPFECDDHPTTNCRGLQNEKEDVQAEDDEEDAGCEPVTVSFCSGVRYNVTHFPNSRSRSAQDSDRILSTYLPLVQAQCHEHLQFFLCGAFVPPCSEFMTELLPCREVCEDVKQGCLPVLTSFGYPWPDALACESFPSESSGELCIGLERTTSEIQNPNTNTDTVHPARRHLGQIRESIGLLQEDLRRLAEDEEENRREELSLILAGLRDSLSGLLSNAKAISSFLEAFEELA